MNLVILTGRIGNDLEVKESKNGNVKVLKFSLAVKGYQKDSTDWIDCVAFNQTANYLGTYAKKGSSIAVEGRLTVEEWESEDGTKRRKTVVTLSRAEIMNGVKASTESEINITSGDLPF